MATTACCRLALAGTYAGTYEGGGSWQVTVEDDGHVQSGAATENDGNSSVLYGAMDVDGRLQFYGTVGGFEGQVRTDGSLWGVWTDAEWLRGFSGQRQEGSPAVNPSCTPPDPTSNGSMLDLSACLANADCPDGLSCHVTLTGASYCAPGCTEDDQCPASCSCETGLFTAEPYCDTVSGTCRLYSPASSASCPLCTGEAPTDAGTLVAGACYFNCAGAVVTQCRATPSDEERCAAGAQSSCSEIGATVEASAFVPGCDCLYTSLAECAPSFFLSTACHFQCTATPTQAGCVPNLDQARCEQVAANNCGGADQVLRRQLVVGCVCTDDDPACGHPNWLGNTPEPEESFLPACFLSCQNGTKACLNQSPSDQECVAAAQEFCAANASQMAEHEHSADCPCSDSSCVPGWWTL